MARCGGACVLVALATLVAYLASPGVGFVGQRVAPARVSRTSLRAGATGAAMDILVTVDQTGMRTRLSVPSGVTIGDMKKMAVKAYGFDFPWMKEAQWAMSKLDGSKDDALEDSKTAGDYGLKNYDEVLMFFTP